MKMYLIVLMLFIGVILSLHLTMNAQVGAIIRNPKVGNAIFWGIGALTALAIGFSSGDTEAFSRLREVPVWLLTAGVMGAALVFGIAWTVPKVGAATAFVLMIAGQVVTGLVLSHFGALGSPVEPISAMKVVGALLLVAGAAVCTFSK
ncbi:DMT family transporter [Spirosoma sp. 209]|uniref:DMT family transporter n=1 Tax=Spirosoma sp. 209 TaxID=1955701 RepID=UPI00098D6691|nr:DMT family transporter [Spirosoma sp. 209]